MGGAFDPVTGLTEETFRALLDSSPDAMIVVDETGTIALINLQTERMFGYDRAELIGQPIELVVPERFHERHRLHHARYFEDPHARPMGAGLDLFARRKDGTEFAVEVSLSSLNTTHGKLISSAVRDVTARKAAEAAANHFSAVVESSSDAIIGKTLDGIVVSWNAGAERLYGYAAEEMLGHSISRLVPPGQDDDLFEIMARVRSGERVEDHQTVRARKDGTLVDVALTVSPIRDSSGTVTGASTIARDISSLVRYQEQLRFLAEHDALTGVINRRRFERELGEQITRARRYSEPAALLMIDVDHFKQINDTHGHKAGDHALRLVATALRRRLRDTDVIARLGGDEFAVLLPYANAQQAHVVADDLRQIVADTAIDLGAERALRLSISVGQAVIDADTVNEDAVLAAADADMYVDKHRPVPQQRVQTNDPPPLALGAG